MFCLRVLTCFFFFLLLLLAIVFRFLQLSTTEQRDEHIQSLNEHKIVSCFYSFYCYCVVVTFLETLSAFIFSSSPSLSTDGESLISFDFLPEFFSQTRLLTFQMKSFFCNIVSSSSCFSFFSLMHTSKFAGVLFYQRE